MSTAILGPAGHVRGTPRIPGDKSISHRGLILGALATGRTEITGILDSADVRSTAQCLGALGVRISGHNGRVTVDGIGATDFSAPAGDLDCGNSGTTMRLLMGVLASRPFSARLRGDESLARRPMRRVTEPLTLMGARFDLTDGDHAPLTVFGSTLHAVNYELPVASAQIKSAVLLAALRAEGVTRLGGRIHSRDHTERLFPVFGLEIARSGSCLSVEGMQTPRGAQVHVPGDPSTAAFWMAAACMVPGGSVEVENLLLNPTRTGFLSVLQRMGADVLIEVTAQSPEPVGRVQVRHRELSGITIEADEIPSLIDELPILAVLATQARGSTSVSGAQELRVKETDRIEAIAENLRAMNGRIETRPDGFVVEGGYPLSGASVRSCGDHRIAMAFSIAAIAATGTTRIEGAECVSVSNPDFYATLRELTT